MAISYTKVGWDTSKYVNPTNMNQMDDGIKAACDGVDALDTEVSTISSNYFPKTASYTQPLTGDLWLQGTGNRTLVIGTQSAGATGYIQLSNSNHYGLMFPVNLTGDRQYRLPDATGTIALTSNISTEDLSTTVTMAPSSTTNVSFSLTVPSGYSLASVTVWTSSSVCTAQMSTFSGSSAIVYVANNSATYNVELTVYCRALYIKS